MKIKIWFLMGLAIFMVISVVVFLVNKSHSDINQNNLQTITVMPQTNETQTLRTKTISGIVKFTNSGFAPQILNIKIGDTVEWDNDTNIDATVNSDPHPTHTNYPPLNLGVFSPGGKLYLTFNKVGTYGYHNHYDSSQTGTIIVN